MPVDLKHSEFTACLTDREMDPLMPALSILDKTVPQDRQQCLLKASKEAKAVRSRQSHLSQGDSGMRDPATAYDEGKMCLHPVFTMQPAHDN